MNDRILPLVILRIVQTRALVNWVTKNVMIYEPGFRGLVVHYRTCPCIIFGSGRLLHPRWKWHDYKNNIVLTNGENRILMLFRILVGLHSLWLNSQLCYCPMYDITANTCLIEEHGVSTAFCFHKGLNPVVMLSISYPWLLTLVCVCVCVCLSALTLPRNPSMTPKHKTNIMQPKKKAECRIPFPPAGL